MGFFTKKKDTPIVCPDPYEETLNQIEIYYSKKGLNKNEARNQASKLFEQCKKQCAEEQTAEYSNIGERVFELAKCDEYLSKCIEIAFKDGARRDEIIAWWSNSDLERKVVLQLDEEARMAAFISQLEDGIPPDIASAKVKKYFPIYGYSEDYDDKRRPLCPELKAMVEDFNRTMSSSDMMIGYMRTLLNQYDEFNELIRDKATY